MPGTIKILFVDDEPAIRLSLPEILRLHGFQVTSAGSVGEAVQAIAAQQFDVLISDLNIGSPGDGFTVVSAMRRTQPNCVTLILTGYPAFETALQAIRSQVDDYLIKPAGVSELVASIEGKLRDRKPHQLVLLKRVPQILHEHVDEVVEYILRSERRILQLPRIHLSEEECRQNVKDFLSRIASHLMNGRPQLSPELMELSQQHGKARYQQGYSASMLVEENRYIADAILDCVRNNLLAADVSQLVPDLRMLYDSLAATLREAIGAHSEVAKAA